MASGKTNYLESKLLDHVLGGTVYTVPGTLYLALFTSAPGETGGGTEVSGGNYARVSITNNTTNWPNAVNGSKSNGVAFTFPQATADWGTVVATAIMDAATVGNMLYYGDLAQSKAINNGDTASFAIGSIVVAED